jgi:hypothetical protein
MARNPNIFYNLVYHENSATELLCNLMRFAAFRRPLLAKLFPGSVYADKIKFGDIGTQIGITDSGRPDLVIRNDDLCALVEVKVEKGCALTGNQPSGYLNALRNDTNVKSERWLVFLVPDGWVHEQELLKRLNRDAPPDGSIKTPKPVYWEDVLDIIKNNDLQDLNPFFTEFYKLLEGWYRPTPTDFSKTELIMLFKKEIPETLAKLGKVIDQVHEMSRAYVTSRSSERTLCPNEYGFYFKGKNGENVLWFGMWTLFWKEKEFPLCFGVQDNWAPSAAQTFLKGYKDKPTKPFRGYTLGWVSQETLASENAAVEIWEQLEPVALAVGAARSES